MSAVDSLGGPRASPFYLSFGGGGRTSENCYPGWRFGCGGVVDHFTTLHRHCNQLDATCGKMRLSKARVIRVMEEVTSLTA